MTPYERELWDQWGNVFIERTLDLDPGHQFKIKEALANEWNEQIVGGARNHIGKAIKAAFQVAELRERLNHLEPPERQGDNHQMYRRI